MSRKKNNPDDMIGFKDFLDYQEEKKPKRRSREANSGFELFTFLERDSQRLQKFIELFEEKSFVLKNYPQDTSLIVSQESSNIDRQIRLTNLLKREDSPLNTALNDLLEEHFNR